VKKEAGYESVKDGDLDAARCQPGRGLAQLSEKVDDAEARFSDVQMHYGSGHPENKKAQAQWNESKRLLDQARQHARRVDVEYRQALNREGMLEKAVNQQKLEF